ncbi:Epithelial discoidin domain-containing receptor 1, partial [Operophtera brumata]
LNQDIKGGAWCPRNQITTESTEWLEIDLHTVHVITGAGTQGRFGNGQGQEYAEAYILTGNTNTYLLKKNVLEPPIWASRIRFLPYSSHRRTVCMRVEVYGCYWNGLTIDDKVTWRKHIETLTKRVRKFIYIFKYLREVADRKLLINIYNALCRSILAYCNVTWGGTCSTYMLQLERAQRAVLKVATFKPYRFPTADLFNECEVLTVRQMYILNIILTQHKSVDVHYNLSVGRRRKDRIAMVPKCNTTSAHRQQFFLGPFMYNKASKYIQNLVKLNKTELGIVSYTMPKGDKRSNGVELTDMTYDGQWGEELRGGLGQLVDGVFGGDEIREAAKNSAWVGWRNDSRPNPPVIVFEFDKVREFSALHLYCNNKFMRDVFSEAIISFSIGGRHFQDEPIHYSYVEDNIFEHSRNVSIKLHHRIGRWKPPAKDKAKQPTSKEVPITTARQEDPLYVAIVVGVLTALVILLAVAIFLIVHRHRHRKCFASPTAKSAVSQKRTLDSYSACGTSMMPENKMVIDCPLDVKSDEYQEPYQPLKCAPYFSYSTLSSAPLLTKRRLADSMSDRLTDIVGDRMDSRLSAAGSLRSKHST